MTTISRYGLCLLAAGLALAAPAGYGAAEQPEEAGYRLYRDAYSAVIRAEQARDAGSQESALELFAASLRAFRELGEKYPGFRPEIVEARTHSCIDEIRALLKQEALQKKSGETLAALLDAPVPHFVPPPAPPPPPAAPSPDVRPPAATAEPATRTAIAPAARDAAPEEDVRALKRRLDDLTRDREKTIRKLTDQVKEAEQQAALDREAREATEKKLSALEKEYRKLQGRLKETEAKLPKPPAAAAGKEESSGWWIFGHRSRKADDKGKTSAVTNKASAVVQVVVPPAPPPDPVRRAVVEEAMQCMRKGEWSRAHELIVAGLARHAADSELQLMLGMVQCREGRFGDAVKTLRPLTERDPADAKARVALGAAYIALGQYIDARMELLAAVGFAPDMSEAHYNLAQVLLWGKPSDPEMAGDHYRQAVKLGAAPDPAFELELEKVLSGRPAGKEPR